MQRRGRLHEPSPTPPLLFRSKLDGYYATMSGDGEKIIAFLADGEQRTFNDILVATGLESTALEDDLKSLTDEALIELTFVPDDDLYLITAKGLLAASDRSA
jgi:hypothetical protein